MRRQNREPSVRGLRYAVPGKPHYTLRSETAHTHNVNGEEVLHRVRSAAGKDPVYTCDAEDEQDRIDLEGATPHPAWPRPGS